MTTRAAWRREARQFQQLVRVSYRRLLDAVLASRDIDAEQFALWGAALLATPLLYAAFIWPSRYPWLRAKSLEQLHNAGLADRLFFVTWPMLVALFVGALLWDGLFPDRTDQHVMGVLPVRSRTVAAARITAAVTSMTVLLVGISLPAALVYAVAGAAHPSVGRVPGIFVGQMAASVAAGLFAFGVLLTVRGGIALAVGASTTARMPSPDKRASQHLTWVNTGDRRQRVGHGRNQVVERSAGSARTITPEPASEVSYLMLMFLVVIAPSPAHPARV